MENWNASFWWGYGAVDMALAVMMVMMMNSVAECVGEFADGSNDEVVRDAGGSS